MFHYVSLYFVHSIFLLLLLHDKARENCGSPASSLNTAILHGIEINKYQVHTTHSTAFRGITSVVSLGMSKPSARQDKQFFKRWDDGTANESEII